MAGKNGRIEPTDARTVLIVAITHGSILVHPLFAVNCSFKSYKYNLLYGRLTDKKTAKEI
jgi:hypothetical protein